MANQHNNVGVTDDDIKKTKEYTDALDALKNSINGVNSKLPEFSEGLQAGLKAIGEKLPEVVDAMVKLNALLARVSRMLLINFDYKKFLML